LGTVYVADSQPAQERALADFAVNWQMYFLLKHPGISWQGNQRLQQVRMVILVSYPVGEVGHGHGGGAAFALVPVRSSGHYPPRGLLYLTILHSAATPRLLPPPSRRSGAVVFL
jgi:hypothetical protein